MSVNSTFEWIDPSELSVDLRVQRPADLKRINDLAIKYDPVQVGTIVVSRRPDNSMVVLDGQTRVGAKAKAGAPGPIHAQVYTGLDIESEATMFLARNNSKPVSALDKFVVRVTEGDPTAVIINNIVEGHGWKTRAGNNQGSIQSVVALEKVFVRGGDSGADIVNTLMKCITQAWGYENAAVNGSLIGGVGELLLRYGRAVDTQKLIREMQSTTPRTILGRARAQKEAKVFSDALPVVVGRILHVMHNDRLRKNALPEWK